MSKKILFLLEILLVFFANILQLTYQTTICAVFGRFQCENIKKGYKRKKSKLLEMLHFH